MKTLNSTLIILVQQLSLQLTRNYSTKTCMNLGPNNTALPKASKGEISLNVAGINLPEKRELFWIRRRNFFF